MAASQTYANALPSAQRNAFDIHTDSLAQWRRPNAGPPQDPPFSWVAAAEATNTLNSPGGLSGYRPLIDRTTTGAGGHYYRQPTTNGTTTAGGHYYNQPTTNGTITGTGGDYYRQPTTNTTTTSIGMPHRQPPTFRTTSSAFGHSYRDFTINRTRRRNSAFIARQPVIDSTEFPYNHQQRTNRTRPTTTTMHIAFPPTIGVPPPWPRFPNTAERARMSRGEVLLTPAQAAAQAAAREEAEERAYLARLASQPGPEDPWLAPGVLQGSHGARLARARREERGREQAALEARRRWEAAGGWWGACVRALVLVLMALVQMSGIERMVKGNGGGAGKDRDAAADGTVGWKLGAKEEDTPMPLWLWVLPATWQPRVLAAKRRFLKAAHAVEREIKYRMSGMPQAVQLAVLATIFTLLMWVLVSDMLSGSGSSSGNAGGDSGNSTGSGSSTGEVEIYNPIFYYLEPNVRSWSVSPIRPME